MSIALNIVFRGLAPNRDVERIVRYRAADLMRFLLGPASCEVIVDAGNESWDGGGRFHAIVKLKVASGDTFCGGDNVTSGRHLIADALDAAFDDIELLLSERPTLEPTAPGQSHARLRAWESDGDEVRAAS